MTFVAHFCATVAGALANYSCPSAVFLASHTSFSGPRSLYGRWDPIASFVLVLVCSIVYDISFLLVGSSGECEKKSSGCFVQVATNTHP